MTYSTLVFVGDHPLLVACAGRAREAGLNVAAVSTDDASIAAWAAGEGIELVEVVATETGALPADAALVAIVRQGERLPQGKCQPQEIREGDRIVVLRDTHRPAG